MPIFGRRAQPEAQIRPADIAPLPTLKVLGVDLIHDERPDHRLMATIALRFETPAGPQQTTASLSWETMSQIRSVMSRAGKSITDLEILEKVLVPWTVEQVDLSWQTSGTLPAHNVLDFGDAPRPAAATALLARLGFL